MKWHNQITSIEKKENRQYKQRKKGGFRKVLDIQRDFSFR